MALGGKPKGFLDSWPGDAEVGLCDAQGLGCPDIISGDCKGWVAQGLLDGPACNPGWCKKGLEDGLNWAGPDDGCAKVEVGGKAGLAVCVWGGSCDGGICQGFACGCCGWKGLFWYCSGMGGTAGICCA